MKSLILLTSILFSISLSGQNIIAVQQGGNATFYSNIESAIPNAVNGDTIYLPGGTFTMPSPINKSIHIVGAGSFIDSSVATGITILTNLFIASGADGGSIEGVLGGVNNVAPSITFILNGTPITNYTISKCNLPYGISFQAPCSLITIKQNYIGTSSIGSINGGPTNSMISNNFITGPIATGNNNLCRNNNFINISLYLNSPGCIFENNIFLVDGQTSGLNQIFNNNIGINPNIQYGNSGVNNFNETFDNTFINPGTSPNFVFDFHNNYNLKSTSLGKNAGTDGTDIGVYGGTFPWKDGMIPFNPHIQTKNIPGVTDAAGNLHIDIKAASQDH